MGLLRTAVRSLRSRRLAIGLIAVVAVYGFIATVVPQAARDAAAVRAWPAGHPVLAPVTRALGLHSAFSSPLFLAAVALLAASTAACSWERTRTALLRWRSSGRVSESEIARLRERPATEVALPPGTDPLTVGERELARSNLRVRRGPRLLEASSGRLGLVGSPLFHWTLTALFVVIALGRLTRAEGLMGLPVGFPRTDTAESYRKLEAGPLYRGHTGLTLLVTDVRPFKDAAGVDRGVSPYVEMRQGPTLLRRQRVYPNNPLRYGSLLVHSGDYGLAVPVSIESSTGEQALKAQPLLDFDDKSDSGTTRDGFDIAGAEGGDISVSVTVPLDRVGGKPQHARPRDRRAEVTVRSSAVQTSTVLRVGESLPLPGGLRLKLDDLVYYARLSVADDWSVYPMYVLFVLAALSLALSLLVPYRRVVVLAADGELRALVRTGRVDAVFAGRVEAALRAAAGRPEARDAGEELA